MDPTLRRKGSFKKSLAFLQKVNPSLAYQLKMTDPSDLIFCQTKQGELNLQRSYENQVYHYHSPIDALKEANDWFQSLDLHIATAIFVYGVGLGYYYEAAKSWLKQHPHHALIFLEEDLGVLHRLCETELGLHLLKDPQVKVCYFQSFLTDKMIFNELSWTYFESPFISSNLKLYEQVNPEGCSQLGHELAYYFERKKLFIHEYLEYGLVFFRNFYSNILELPQSYWGNGLFHSFPQVPAIICGAGPSLDKNMLLLPGLKERALLFAGGSALNAMIPKGILPHFGVATDPHIYQYSRVITAQHHPLPFFYRSRLFHAALTAMKGPRLYLTGAGGYETPHWFEKELNIEGEDLDEGHNVVNFSLQIAQALGCNPIILVGVDLAFTDQRYYAEGIASGLNVKEEDLKDQVSPILKKDMNGEPIWTLWKWVIESQWISDFAELHPEIRILNATEGGLGFKNIPNISLTEAAEQFLKNDRQEIQQIEKEIDKHSLKHLRVEQVIELLQRMRDSLHHCSLLYTRLIEENSQLTEEIKQNNASIPRDLPQTPSMALIETHIEAEIGYHYLLNIFDQIHIHLHHREAQDLQSPKHRLSVKKRALKKLDLQKRRLLFLHDVAHFNQLLIERTLQEKHKNH